MVNPMSDTGPNKVSDSTKTGDTRVLEAKTHQWEEHYSACHFDRPFSVE